MATRRPCPSPRSRPLPRLERAALSLATGTLVCTLGACADAPDAKDLAPVAVASGGEQIHVEVRLAAVEPAPVVYVRPAYVEPRQPAHIYLTPVVDTPPPVYTPFVPARPIDPVLDVVPPPGAPALVTPRRAF